MSSSVPASHLVRSVSSPVAISIPRIASAGPVVAAGCGDGVVDLFDVLEAIDIILGLQAGTACQLERANVPNGMPPYCGDPAGHPNCYRDGDLDMLDVLVIMDMAAGQNQLL